MRQELRNKCSSAVFCALMLHVSSPDHTLNVVGNLDYSSVMGFLKTTKKTL